MKERSFGGDPIRVSDVGVGTWQCGGTEWGNLDEVVMAAGGPSRRFAGRLTPSLAQPLLRPLAKLFELQLELGSRRMSFGGGSCSTRS